MTSLPSEGLEHFLEVGDVELEFQEFGCIHPASASGFRVRDRYQSQKDLPRSGLLVLGETIVELFSLPAEGAVDSSHLTIRAKCERVANAPVEEIGEGELEEGQGARFSKHVSDEGGFETRFQSDASP